MKRREKIWFGIAIADLVLLIGGAVIVTALSGCGLFMKPYNYNLYIDSTPMLDLGMMSCHPDSTINKRKLCDPNLHI